MRPLLVPALLLSGSMLGGCGPGSEARSAGRQQPIESACGRMPRSADRGLVSHTELDGDAQARVLLQNVSGTPRRVVPLTVAVCRGPCGSGWTECCDQRSFSAKERSRYATSLEPGQTIELLVDARLHDRGHACEKAGLRLIVDVDGARSCADAGNWIALGSD